MKHIESVSKERQQLEQIDSFLLRAAELLHRYGTPSFRLEGVMTRVATTQGLHSEFLYTPTALFVGLGYGESQRTYVRRVQAEETDISKLLALDQILEDLESGRISVSDAAERLEQTASDPPPFRLPVALLASAIACSGVAVIFGGSWLETLIAGFFGLAIAYLAMAVSAFTQRGLLEPFLGFTVALCAVALGHWLPVNYRLITMAALILPIPGLTLTIALTELALQHLSSGSARLAGAMVSLFTLVVGVAIAWRLTDAWIEPMRATMDPLPGWCLWIAVSVTPIALAIVFKAPMSQWPAIMLVVISGFLTSRTMTEMAGPEVGALLGAMAVGCGSNIYARLFNRPAIIPQTPGLLILVPGTIGYSALTAMIDNQTIRGVELAFSMSILGVALVGGLLLANQLISPKRIL
ncbi:MAG: threonine/serine exporter family protein [Planctomycetota bacterium]|nr:threonine/serine exporter family protein [Planctomycetota bacterium]